MQSTRCSILLPMFRGLLIITTSPTKTAEPIAVLFGVWTQVGPRNQVIGGGLNIFRVWAIWGKYLPADVKCRDYQACDQYSQSHSTGGSSDVTFHSQYCSNLFESRLLSMLVNCTIYRPTGGSQ